MHSVHWVMVWLVGSVNAGAILSLSLDLEHTLVQAAAVLSLAYQPKKSLLCCFNFVFLHWHISDLSSFVSRLFSS